MKPIEQPKQAEKLRAEVACRSFEKSLALQQRFHHVIPGGAHTYAKGDDQYPELMPPYIVRGQGCRVWDVDGNEYIEYGMGLRTVTLGHAYPQIVEAAHRQMKLGQNFSRPAVIEIECAEKLLELLPGAEMVKFAKNGSDATTAAVKLARAVTSREYVALCTDQPFFSIDDWFIGKTPMDAGIPASTKQLSLGFGYNDLSSVQKLFDSHKNGIAALILEAETTIPPADGFLKSVQELCRKNGTIFILDEMITGFRWPQKFAQLKFGIQPDLTCIGKGFGNGSPISALVGKRELMKCGGLDHSGERVFLLSTTHGAETVSMAVALAVMEIYERENVVDFLQKQGEKLAHGISQTATELGISDYFEIIGQPANLVYATRDADKRASQAYRTLFIQECLKRGLLAPSFVVSYSHSDEVLKQTMQIVGEVLSVYKSALETGINKYLQGRPVKPVFRKQN